MADYSAGSASVTITPDLSRFATTLRTEMQRIKQTYGVEIEPNTAGFSAKVRAELDRVSAQTATVNVQVNADTAAATAQIAAATRDHRATINVDADTGAAAAQITAAARNHTATINVDQDGASTAEAQIDAAARNRTSRIRVDTSGAVSAITAMGTATQGVLSAGAGIAGMGTAIGSIGVLAAGAIGPLSAMGGAILSAGGALAALPGIAAAAGAGIAALGIGLNGVGKAFSALGAESSAAGGAAAGGMDTAAQAAQDAARSIERAQRGIQDAERGVADAQRNSQRAQKQLNDARKEAVRDLEDMNDQLKDAALDEEGAVLAVARAKERLQETKADSGSSSLDIAEADLAYRQAINTLEDTRSANNRLAVDTAKANAAGVEGAANVVSAKESVEAAQRGEEDAARRLADAQLALADAQRQAAQQTAQASSANNAAADAMDRLSPNAQAFVLAVRSMGDQWTDLRKATQDNLFAGMAESVTTLGEKQLPVLKTGMTGIASALNTDIRSAMGVFSTDDAANKFGVFLENSRRGTDALGNAMAPISRIFINLTTAGSAYFERFGNAITGVFDGWDQKLSQATQNGDFDAFMERSINSAKLLWSIFSNAGSAIGNVFRIASSTSGGFMQNLDETMQQFNRWTESAEGKNDLAEFFTATGGALKAVAPLIGKVANIFATVFAPGISNFIQGAAPGFSKFLDGLRTGMEGIAPAMPAIGAAFGALAASLAPVLASLGTFAGPLLQALAIGVQATAPVLGPLVAMFGGLSLVLMKLGPIMNIVRVGMTIMSGVFGVASKVIKGVTMVWKLLSLAFSASPIGFVIALIAGLVAGLVWFFTQTEVGKRAWKSFMNFMNGVWEGIKEGFSWVWDKIKEFFGNMVDTITSIPEKFGELKDKIFEKVRGAKDWLVDTGKDIVDGLLNGIGNIGEAIGNWILDKVPGPIKKVVKKALGLEDGGEVPGLRFGGNVYGLPTYAGGGQLPTTGPGTNEVDGILGVGDDGLPTARVNAGEYVVNATQTSRFRAVLESLNAGNKQGALAALQAVPGLYKGGRVPALASGGTTGGGASSGASFSANIDTNGLTEAQGVFGTVAQRMQQTAAATLTPLWSQQSAAVGQFGQTLTTNMNAAGPRFQAMGASLLGTKSTVIDPMFRGVSNNLTNMSTKFRTEAQTAVQPVWRTMAATLTNVKATVVDPMFAGLSRELTSMGVKFTSTAQNVVQPVWREMASFMEQIRAGAIVPTFNHLHTGLTALEGWFGTTVGNVNTAWDKLRPGTGKPARFVVETVFNNGIRNAWNNIADLIDGKKLNAVNLGSLGAYASGGTVDTVPGYSPGYDDHTFSNGKGSSIHLSGGEAIMRPEWTKAVGGVAAVNRMNRQAQNGTLGAHASGGIVPGVNAFAGGGVVEAMTRIVQQKYPGMQMTSGYRAGDGGNHGAGLAGDFSDAVGQNSPGMLSLANDIAKTYPNSMELIHDNPLFNKNIKNGAFVGKFGEYYTLAQAGPHHHHVHWAMNTPPTMPFGGGVFAGGSSGDGAGMVSMTDMVADMWKSETENIAKWTGSKSRFSDGMNSLRQNMIDQVGKFAKSQAEAIGVGPGSPAGEGAERWRPMVIKAFKFQGEDPTKFRVDGLVGQIGYESGGQEKVLQNGYVDINTGGNEAGGLLQFVPGTFASFRDPRIAGDRFDGWANINAGVRYYRDHWNYSPWIGRQGPHGWKEGGVLDKDDPTAERVASEQAANTYPASESVTIGKEDPVITGDASADDLNDFRESDKSDPNNYDDGTGTGTEEDSYEAPQNYADIIARHFGYTPPDMGDTEKADPSDPQVWRNTYENIAYTAASGFLDDLLGVLGVPTTPPAGLLASELLTNAIDKRNRQDPVERTIAERAAQDKAVNALPEDLRPAARDLVRGGYNLLPNGGGKATQEQIDAYMAEKAQEEADEKFNKAINDPLADLNADTDKIEKFANGGLIGGPGGPTDDLIGIMASSGEFITNAASVAQAGPLIAAMNANPAAAGALQAGLVGAQAAGRGMSTAAASLASVRNAYSAVSTSYAADAATTLSNVSSPQTNAGKTINLHYHVETNTAQEGLRMAEQQARQQVLVLGGA